MSLNRAYFVLGMIFTLFSFYIGNFPNNLMTGIFFLTIGIGCFIMSYVGRDRWQGPKVRSHWSLMRHGVMPFNKFWLGLFGVVMGLGGMLAALAYYACSTINPVIGLTGCGPTGVWGSVETRVIHLVCFRLSGVGLWTALLTRRFYGEPCGLGHLGPSSWIVDAGNGNYAIVRARRGDPCPRCGTLVSSPVCPECGALISISHTG